MLKTNAPPTANSALLTAAENIRAVLLLAEHEIGAVAVGFEELGRTTSSILDDAAIIIACVEDHRFLSILDTSKSVVDATGQFVRLRLQSVADVRAVLNTEARLLDQLSFHTRQQKSIARKIQALSVLTKIEVARLGGLGTGFDYLACELASFAESIATDTRILASQTDDSKTVIEMTKHMLDGEFRHIQRESARLEVELENALSKVKQGIAKLSAIPDAFRNCVVQMAAQIDGVIAAVQTNDITRQQMEHVQQSLQMIASVIVGAHDAAHTVNGDLADMLAGLVIQVHQLKNSRETIHRWIDQIDLCLEGILRISSSDVSRIGPDVLVQERNLSSQLGGIAKLEQDCQADNQRLHGALARLAELIQLVSEHEALSKTARERLELLSFNSIIEANRLGTRADAILEISQSIKSISAEWTQLTALAGSAIEKILSHAMQAQENASTSSLENRARMHDAHQRAVRSLDHLHTVALDAAQKAIQIEDATSKMRSSGMKTSAATSRLAGCLASLEMVQREMEQAAQELRGHALLEPGDPKQVERLFAASYTTEIERQVLHSALYGTPVETTNIQGIGNDVELF